MASRNDGSVMTSSVVAGRALELLELLCQLVAGLIDHFRRYRYFAAVGIDNRCTVQELVVQRLVLLTLL